MKHYAILKDSVVIEVLPETVEVDGSQAHVNDRYAADYLAGAVECSGEVQPGFIYDAGEFRAPSLPVSPPPGVVTMRQARLALLAAGLLDQVEDAIGEGSDRAAQIEWEYAATVERDSPFVAQLANLLQLDEKALDDLFVMAGEL